MLNVIIALIPTLNLFMAVYNLNLSFRFANDKLVFLKMNRNTILECKRCLIFIVVIFLHIHIVFHFIIDK